MADTAFRIGPLALTAVPVTERTIPGATTFVMRNVHVANETALPATFTLSIGVDGAGKRLWKDVPVPGNGGAFDWSGFEPVMTGEVIQAFASVVAALTLTIGGVDIT